MCIKWGEEPPDGTAPVVPNYLFRTLLSHKVASSWCYRSIDFKGAYLNATLPAPKLCRIPPGMLEVLATLPEYATWIQDFMSANSITKLEDVLIAVDLALYGFCESGKLWHRFLTTVLVERLGFKISEFDPTVYFREGIYLCTFVDNLPVIAKTEKHFLQLYTELEALGLQITEESPDFTLGIRLIHDDANEKLYMALDGYIAKTLASHNLTECNPNVLPLKPDTDLVLDPSSKDPNLEREYNRICGQLVYPAYICRADISTYANYLSRYRACSNESHMEAATSVLRYLKGTSHFALCFAKENASRLPGVQAFVDADFAKDPNQRYSVSGICIYLHGNLVYHQSQKQTVLAKGTDESETIALGDYIDFVIWYTSFLIDLHLLPPDAYPTLHTDSDVVYKRIINLKPIREYDRNIGIRIKNCQEKWSSNCYKLCFVKGTQNPSDGLTKFLALPQFRIQRERYGIVPIPPHLR